VTAEALAPEDIGVEEVAIEVAIELGLSPDIMNKVIWSAGAVLVTVAGAEEEDIIEEAADEVTIELMGMEEAIDEDMPVVLEAAPEKLVVPSADASNWLAGKTFCTIGVKTIETF
jgi:hypothetical protein